MEKQTYQYHFGVSALLHDKEVGRYKEDSSAFGARKPKVTQRDPPDNLVRQLRRSLNEIFQIPCAVKCKKEVQVSKSQVEVADISEHYELTQQNQMKFPSKKRVTLGMIS